MLGSWFGGAGKETKKSSELSDGLLPEPSLSDDTGNLSDVKMSGQAAPYDTAEEPERLKLKSIQVTIRAGTAREFPVSVFPGCVVEWNFQTKGGDISFVVFLELDNGELITLVPKQRYSSDQEMIHGQLVVKEVGTLWLHWDNVYSWFKNKELVYSITRDFHPKTSIVFVLNSPSVKTESSKICQQVVNDFRVSHLSLDELLQAEQHKKSKDGALISAYLAEKKPVPVEVAIKILLRELEGVHSKVALIEGFPLSEDDFHAWERETSDGFKILGVLYLCDMSKSDGLDQLVKLFDPIWKVPLESNQFEQAYSIVKDVMEPLVPAPTSIEDEAEEEPVANGSHVEEKKEAQEETGSARAATTADAAATKNTQGLRIILGTMTMAGQVSSVSSLNMVQEFVDSELVQKHKTGGKVELDTARLYQGGKTEKILGDILARDEGLLSKVYIATKANPFQKNNLRPENVIKQVEQSLDALQLQSVDLLYLHAPDHNTEIESTLSACNTLHLQGKFREFGLSNYTAWETVHIWHLCKRNGWVLPTVYQGMYNAVTRQVEPELFPALRRLNIRFYAYNPLAGGMLTGKYKDILSKPNSGRFGLSHFKSRYLPRFWNDQYFEAIDAVRKACVQCDISMTDAAFRWLSHHSELRGGHNDGVIIGASSLDHMRANIKALGKGPLPQSVVNAFDTAAEICKPVCPNYFR